jgi:hypothetical protein
VALIPNFTAINYMHTYRDFNREVDELSKHALELQEGRLKYFRWRMDKRVHLVSISVLMIFCSL